jgi:hypothetical protein
VHLSISSIGLLLDIVGVILLWRFGLPPDVNRHGASFVFPASAANSAEAIKAKIYDLYGKNSIVAYCSGLYFSIYWFTKLIMSTMSNPTLKRDCAKARSPLAPR